MINVLSFGKKKFLGQKSCEFFFFSPSVNLTNSANFWGKSPTFKYQKIKGKKKKNKQTNMPTFTSPIMIMCFLNGHIMYVTHTSPTKATLEGHCGTT